MVAPRPKPKTVPAPFTGPHLRAEFLALRQELRIHTLVIVVVFILGIILAGG